ncbi:MAG: dioxygenase [Deltaproteobacteria bacterium]|nr:dioxygenase [Deltaproteobacteria bacterium]
MGTGHGSRLAGIGGVVALLALGCGCDAGAAAEDADAPADTPADRGDAFDGAGEADVSDGAGDAETFDGAGDADVSDGTVDDGAEGADGASCAPTAANILGPYYLEGAPERWDLVEPATAGTRLTVTGVVRGPECVSIAGAVVDVWQADADGVYDNVGWTLRGWSRADAAGSWRLHTIVPGRYATGGTFRPAHIHVRVSAPGFLPLTTQLYFAGDPYNETDPYYVPSLALEPEAQADGSLAATFDFVLTAG